MVGLAIRKTLRGILILALVPTGSACSEIWQYPRFIAKKRNSMVKIICDVRISGDVTWFWKQDKDSDLKPLHLEEGRILQNQTGSNATLTIQDIQFQDNGVYYCQIQCSKGLQRGCGTELRVLGGFGACSPAREGSGSGWGHRVFMEPSTPHHTPACHQ